MKHFRRTLSRGRETVFLAIGVFALLPLLMGMVAPPLDASNVLILVNADSPVSRSVADLYCRYYPEIEPVQILYLYGLPDCASLDAGPESEIITRDQYETLIAQPVRSYLTSQGMVDSVYCIITTAGIPYRIEDTHTSNPNLSNVVYPAGSSGGDVVNHRGTVDAASVESELAIVFQSDPVMDPPSAQAPKTNRIVNVYQGYRSGIRAWEADRDILSRREGFGWTIMIGATGASPFIEGDLDLSGITARNRRMSPADIYLVARLDGPRTYGEYPLFAVQRMLERSAAVSNPSHRKFVGYNPDTSAFVCDEAGTAAGDLAMSNVYNVLPQEEGRTLSFEDHPVPPGAETLCCDGGCSFYNCYFNGGNHYKIAFEWLTGEQALDGGTTLETAPILHGLRGQVLWDDTANIMNSMFLDRSVGLMGLMTYGINGGDGRPADYLYTAGPGETRLFQCAPGAVFVSLESYNAVTMCADVDTQPVAQGKIADFLSIGGTAAVGHAFEPVSDAAIQGDFLFRNLIRDEDGDGVGDMTFVEAAFTAMPYLGWAEVVVGDPLMRLRTGPGGLAPTEMCPGDANGDGVVDYLDYVTVFIRFNAQIGQPNYDPLADMDESGDIGFQDWADVYFHFNTVCPGN